MSQTPSNSSGAPRGVLSGKRVLELGRVLAAPYASQILGDLGAEIFKFERPGQGDDSRHYAPVYMPAIPGAPGLAGQRGDAAEAPLCQHGTRRVYEQGSGRHLAALGDQAEMAAALCPRHGRQNR